MKRKSDLYTANTVFGSVKFDNAKTFFNCGVSIMLFWGILGNTMSAELNWQIKLTFKELLEVSSCTS